MAGDTIINANCLDALRTLERGSVDLIFADPPYWMRVAGSLRRVEGTAFSGCEDEWDNRFRSLGDYESFTEEWLTECRRVLARDGSIWVIGGMQCIYTIGGIMQRLGYWLINDVVWHKKNPTPNFRGTRVNNSHETLIWAAKSKSSKYVFNYKTAKQLNIETVTPDEYKQGIRKQLGSVWRIGVCQGVERLKDEKGEKLHAAQKPEELLYRIIVISSKVGDTVLDPFAGTMTSGAVAKRTGRRYIMIEEDTKYCMFGEKRISDTEQRIGDIETAAFDRKPPKAGIADLVRDGYLLENEVFYRKDGQPAAVLRAGARLEYEGRLLDMHACAALASGGKADRINGFGFWRVLRGGKLVGIDDIREAYRLRRFSTRA